MNHYIKSAAILCAVAAVSYFVAQAVIPDRRGVAPEQARAEATERREPIVVTTSEIKTLIMDTSAASVPEVITPITKAPAPEAKAIPPITKTASPETKTIPPITKTSAPPSVGAPYKIERAAVCANIVNKAPEGVTSKFPKDAPRALFYTHITGSRDTTAAIIHRWYLNGKAVQTSLLPVKSPNWRTHSRRNFVLNPDNVGKWRVEAIEPKSGKVLETAEFVVE